MDDLADTALAVFVAVLTVAGLWAVADRRSRAARGLREALGGRMRLLLTFLALGTFAVIAEDALEHETGELILQLDRWMYGGAQALAATPAVRAAATAVSRATGEWLAVGVLLAGAALVGMGRRRDGVLLLSGTLGAWLLHVALKAAFQIPRPNAPFTRHLVSGYGFPSGHVLVTLTACGLLAWILGRAAGPPARAALSAAVAAVALLTGIARVVKGVHWPSDVVAGLAAGTVWLNAVTLVARRDAESRRRRAARGRASDPALPAGSSRS